MSEAAPEFDPATAATVGRVLAPHGLRGELKVQSFSDFPQRFDPGATLWLDGRPLTVERSRWQGKGLVLKLEGTDSREAAEALRGRELQAPLIEDLGEDTYYRDDLIGLKVLDGEGAALGTLAEILATGSNDVYVVRGSRGDLLLPATDDVIKSIDLAARTIVVEVIEGLAWVGGAPPREPRRVHGV